ncbi:MAG: hypothetical protein WBK47_09480 [Acetomicrobium sp.]
MDKKDRIIQCEEMMEKAVMTKDAELLKKLLGHAVLFRDFSPRNSILISLQCPGATAVMGKRSWERYGVKPRNEEDCIYITGIKRQISGDPALKKKWIDKNPFKNIDLPEIPASRLRDIREGTAIPREEELELASQKTGRNIKKEYETWKNSKPKELKNRNYFIPVRVYDISQCEITDEEKFKTFPKPKMKINEENASEFFEKIKQMLEEKGFKIDDSAPQVVGRAVKNVLLIDGEANNDEKLFQLIQAWSDTKTKNIPESVMSAAMFMLYSGYSDEVSEEVLETIFLKAKSQRALSSVITKSGYTFRDMLSEYEEFAEKEIKREKESILEEIEPDWLEF